MQTDTQLQDKHQEIPIKVNAWIDKGVAELVTALNLNPLILTVDSCECDGFGLAYVSFYYKSNSRDLFFTSLGSILAKEVSFEFTLESVWRLNYTEPAMTLRLRPADIPELAKCLISNFYESIC